jgi:ATP synthase I chain
MEADSEFYSRALTRVYRFMIWTAAAAALAALFLKGAFWTAMFLAGAAASWLNFSWLHQAVNALGPDARPTRKRVLVFVALRYLLLGIGGYVIVKVFGVNAVGALAGLFVPVAAIIVEILYELVHGT